MLNAVDIQQAASLLRVSPWLLPPKLMSSYRVKTLAEAVEASMIATIVVNCMLGGGRADQKTVETV